MRIDKRIYLPIVMLLCVSFACAAPASPAPILDPNAVNTLIVQTAQKALTLSAVPNKPLQTETPSPTLTSSSTPTQTFTVTPNYTFTPLVPIISVSVDTNCRSGPGKVYDYKGALLVGETAQIFGR